MKLSHVILGGAAALFGFGSAHALSNVALLGTASQSSEYGGGPAVHAIDGNTDGNWYHGSVTATNADIGLAIGNGYSWWKVVLDKSYLVDSITIWNRTDCCADRLSDFTVSLFSGGTLDWSGVYKVFSGPSPSTTFAGIGKVGDTVFVQLNRQNYLSLAEVQVFASAVPEPATYALLFGGLVLVGAVARRRAV
jgi:hypothetical protein